MNTLRITPPSSAGVIPFPASGKPTYMKAAKRWWKMAMAHPNVTHADRTFCSAIFDGFNVEIYKQTGQLVSWKSWDTIEAEFGLHKRTIAESQNRVESLGLLAVDHGRYDHTTKRREHNTYRAIQRSAVQGANGAPRLGANGAPRGAPEQGAEQGAQNAQDSSSLTRRGESYSYKREISESSESLESSDSAKTSDSANRTPERALRPEAEKEQASTTPEFKRLMAPIVARNRVATNGSGDL
jgi:hypothetical protein